MQKPTKLGISCLLILSMFLCACGPKTPTVSERRAEKRQQDSLSLVEQQRTFAYYDSVQQSLLPKVDSLLPLFGYDKNEQYEPHGQYTLRRLRTQVNSSRNYLKASVRDDGQTIVTGFYYGAKPIDWQSITITADSLSDTFTGSTHAFEQHGYHETLTLTHEDAIRLLGFIDAYRDSRIRITYQGNRSRAVYYLSPYDKQDLLTTLHLGMLLHDITELNTRLQKTSLQIEKYQKRLLK